MHVYIYIYIYREREIIAIISHAAAEDEGHLREPRLPLRAPAEGARESKLPPIKYYHYYYYYYY